MWLRHIRGKGGKVDRGANLMKGGTHSKLMHSNIFAMRPMKQLFAHPLNLSSSQLCLHWYMLTKAAIGFRFDCSRRSSKGLQAMSVAAERPRDET